ncbi:tRNA 2-thiouridine(34) synthase MnmA [Buchnera aphidicola (Formosaphis micheliae)]|uniref:tRNA 2-thiouridine(34) synthase MnmA n=1 Tax=Buchnera aphidicola TaxID=9 RepID=UPI0031B82CFE
MLSYQYFINRICQNMYKKHRKKVIVAMSGGVDSSVSAWLLLKKNYHVEGCFMKNWEEEDNNNYCSAYKDLSDAKKVCDQLGIYLHKINFSSEYWEYVFKNFISEYKNGNTPNPDILCNKEIKFKTFLNFALEELGANFIATGHYVRKKVICNQIRLLRGIDENKDQSYFLYTLNAEQIKKTLFPIGMLKKSQVRYIAKKIDIVVAHKKDSTGICFIEPKKFSNFLNRYLSGKKGNIVNTLGQIIGTHTGVIYYTLGQRKGLGIGGIRDSKNNSPWYVVDKNIITNTLTVAQGNKNIYLMSLGCIVTKLSWVNNKILKKSLICTVKTRYRQEDIPCCLVPINSDCIKVIFKKSVFSVTPGQSAVFYLLEVCIGGGIINKRIPVYNENN